MVSAELSTIVKKPIIKKIAFNISNDFNHPVNKINMQPISEKIKGEKLSGISLSKEDYEYIKLNPLKTINNNLFKTNSQNITRFKNG